jgi:hypothetical protein
MAESWFYADGGGQVGPVDAKRLRELASAGVLRPDTSVWKEGLAEWIPASKLKGLFGANPSLTPAVPPPLSAPPRPPQIVGVAGSAPRVQRRSDTEVLIFAPRSVAFEQVGTAMQKLGSVKTRDPGQTFIDGRIRYGLNPVKVRASLVERDPGQTTVVLQGTSGEVWGVAARNASRRLVQMIENLDNPSFKADRLGINPVALVVIVIAFAIVVFIIVSFVV